MIKGSILQEYKITLNVYAPDKKTSKYMNQKWIELNGKIDKSTVIAGEFNTPVSVTDRPSRQSVRTFNLNDTVSHLNQIDIYRTLHPTRAEYAFFSSSHEHSPNKEHFLGHKTYLNKIGIGSI